MSSQNFTFDNLENVFHRVNDEKTDFRELLSIRSRLGYLLNRSAKINPKKTFSIVAKALLEREADSVRSLTYVASITYTLKFLPKKDRKTEIEKIKKEFINCATYNDENHFKTLNEYLKNGGIAFLPFCDLILEGLLKFVSDKHSYVYRPISTIIGKNPVEYSKVFWKHAASFSPLIIVKLISCIAKTANLCPPDDNDLIKTIIDTSVACSDQKETFYMNEIGLETITWLVKEKVIEPTNIRTDYEKLNINSIAIEAWGEYASYGDLSKLPSFPETESLLIRKSYAKLIINATKNPTFDIKKFDFPHWFYRSIRDEILGKEVKENHSLLELSSEEMILFKELGNYLPGWVFIHAMRARKKSEVVQAKLISFVELIPKCILFSYFDDFLDFIDWCITFPIIDKVEHMINILSGLLYTRIDEIVESIAKKIDYFNEDDLGKRLTIITALSKFSISNRVFSIFDIIWETIPIINLSSTLNISILRFLTAIYCEKIEPRRQRFIEIGLAPIHSLFLYESKEYLTRTPQFEAFYEASFRFNQCTTSDIVEDPNFNLSKIFSMTSYALQLLQRLPLSTESLEYILNRITVLHRICPINTVTFLIKVLPRVSEFALNRVVSELNSFVNQEAARGEEHIYATIAVFLQSMLKKRSGITSFESINSNLAELSEDSNLTRIIIALDPILLPMLPVHPSQLFLLLERGAPEVNDDIKQSISVFATSTKSKFEERLCRIILDGLKEPQPEVKADGWLFKDFSSNETAKVEVVEPLNYKSKDVFDNFVKNYPLPKDSKDMNRNKIDLIECYMNTEKCKQSLKEIAKSFDDSLIHYLETQPDILAFIISIGIDRAVKSPKDPVSRAIEIRLGHATDSETETEKIQLWIAQNKSYEEVYEETQSETLSSMFLNNESSPESFIKSINSAIPSVFYKSVMLLPEIVIINPEITKSVDVELFSAINIQDPNAGKALCALIQCYIDMSEEQFFIKIIDLLFANISKVASKGNASLISCEQLLPQLLYLPLSKKTKRNINTIKECCNF